MIIHIILLKLFYIKKIDFFLLIYYFNTIINMSSNPYFLVLSFSIYDRDNDRIMELNNNIKNNILNYKYPLQNYKDIHYTPNHFFDFLKSFSFHHPNIKFDVYYKLEYVNHEHINTYQNKLSLYNGIIQDKLLG